MTIKRMARVGGAVALVAGALSACGAAQRRQVAPEPPLAVLPLTSVDGLPFVSVGTDGASPHLWLLDSGFETSVVNARYADSLRLPAYAHQETAAPGGHTDTGNIPGIPLHVGAVTFAPDSLAVIDLHRVEPLVGRHFAGILGHDFLLQYVTRIDYDRQRVELFAPRTFAYAGPGQTLPLWIEAGQAFVMGVLYTNGRATPAKLKLDTGSLDALGLNGSFVHQSDLVRDVPHPIPATGAAIGGAVDAYVVRLDSLLLGTTAIATPVAGYSVETERRGDAGTMGVAVLSRFNLVLDYARHRAIIEVTGRVHRAMRYDASGLLLAGAGSDYRGIVVMSVDSGSAAAAAGIRSGDSLVTIDGEPVAHVGLSGIRARLTQPGAVGLRLARGGRLREVALRLRERL